MAVIRENVFSFNMLIITIDIRLANVKVWLYWNADEINLLFIGAERAKASM